MVGFLLKKFFYDLWDNLFRIMALNLGFLLSLSLAFVLPPLIAGAVPAAVVFCLLAFWPFVYLCAASAALEEASDYRSLSLTDFAKNITASLVPGAVLFVVSALVFVIIRFTIPFYLRFGTLLGTAAAFLCIWICLFAVGTLQFYPAVYRRLGRHPLISLKKCLFIFFDNTGFCMVSLLINLVLTALIIPCPGWSLLFLDEGLRLRILKYDRPVPSKTEKNGGGRSFWDAILAEEREKTGHRTWRDFLFPWRH
ncbi:MAG: hypothetical protein LBO65_10680 [Spirochaetaceae bacterium]|jgi:hypothetical protein|nr:hypothetical protein [Spirochaetaceae bacterium]